MNEEIWCDIKNYEGRYQVSNLGRVKSLVDSNGKFREKILRPFKNSHGYLYVDLWKGGERKRYKVHRLVLMTFNPVDGMENLEVNHLDENKENNHLSNLEWTTHKDNQNHGTRNKRISEKLTNGKLSIPIAQSDPSTNKVINVWKSSMAAERECGFNNSRINDCCRGKRKTHGGFRWCYLYSYISNIDTRIKKVILFDKEYLD